LQTKSCKTNKLVSEVEQKVEGRPEKTGDIGIVFIEGPFDSRHKSHITGSCRNTCFGEETLKNHLN